MPDKTSNVILNFKTDGEVQYASTIKEINTVMNTAAKEYKAQLSAMGQDATATEKLQAGKKKLQIQLEGAQKRTQMLREEYQRMAEDTNTSRDALVKQQGKIADSENAENRLQNSLSKTNDELKKQGDVSVSTAEKLEKISGAGEKVEKFGKGLSAGVTAPVLAVGAASFKAFDEVDSALDGMTEKTGATGKAANNLQKSFNNVAGDGPFEIADVGEAVGTLNQQFDLNGKALDKASTQLLQYAEINGTDVTSSATTAKQSIEAFGMQNKDLGGVLDVTSKAAHDSGVSVDELSQNAVKAAPQAKQLGLNYGETVTMLGRFSKSGVDGTKAMSLLSKASVTYAADGKSLSEGLSDTESKIKNAKSSTEALTIASQVFGTKGASVMVDAIQRGTLNLSDLAKSSENAGGSVKKTFEGTEDPIDKMKTASNNAKIALTEISTTIQGQLASYLQKAVDVLKGLSEWFSKLSPQQKDMAVKIAAIAAAVGPMLIVFGKVMQSFKSIASGISTLKTGFSLFSGALAPLISGIGGVITAIIPFLPIIIGVAAAIAAVIIVVKNWGAITTWLKGVWGGLSAWFSQTWSAIKAVFTVAVDGITSWFKQAWQAVIDWFKNVWTGVKTFFSTIWNGIKLVFTTVIGLITAYIRAEINGWKLIITTVMNAVKLIFSTVWNAIKLVFTTVFNIISTVVKTFFSRLNTTTKIAMNDIKLVFSTIWNAIKTVVTTVVNAIKSVITSVWNGIKSVTSSVWNGIKSTISSVVNGIKSTVSGVWNGLKSLTSSVWSGIKTAISTPINAARDLVSNAIDAIKGFFNFKISWPHIPMPHFSVNPSGWKIGDLLKGKIPTLGLNWNAEGALFTKPTIAGINGGNLQGFGEAGPEAAVPLNDNTWDKMGEAVARHMPGQAPIYLQVDGRTFARLTGADYDNVSGSRINLQKRGLAT